jgi:hypothetical protein
MTFHRAARSASLCAGLPPAFRAAVAVRVRVGGVVFGCAGACAWLKVLASIASHAESKMRFGLESTVWNLSCGAGTNIAFEIVSWQAEVIDAEENKALPA